VLTHFLATGGTPEGVGGNRKTLWVSRGGKTNSKETRRRPKPVYSITIGVSPLTTLLRGAEDQWGWKARTGGDVSTASTERSSKNEKRLDPIKVRNQVKHKRRGGKKSVNKAERGGAIHRGGVDMHQTKKNQNIGTRGGGVRKTLPGSILLDGVKEPTELCQKFVT